MNYLQLFKDFLKDRKSPLTSKAYLETVTAYLKFSNNNPAVENVEKFLSYLSAKRHCGGRSLNRHLAALKSFFKNVIKQKEPLMIEPYRFERKLPVWIDSEEQKRLIAACRSPLARAIVICLLGSGLRLQELCTLKISDVNHKGFLTVMGKGRKERTVAVPKGVIEEIDSYLQWRPDSSIYVFARAKNTVERIVRETARRAHLSGKITPHTLRHSYASSYLDSGGELLHLRDQLGHANLATTNIYVHSKPEQIRKVMPDVLEGKV